MALPVSIDTMKSTINRRGGVARPNRFGVYITHPSKSINSLLNFNTTSSVYNDLTKPFKFQQKMHWRILTQIFSDIVNKL